MKNITSKSLIIAIIGSLLVFIGLTGCKTPQLEKGGAYTTTAAGIPIAPDRAFFVVDAAFDLAYAGVDAAFTFEKKNRLMLWQISPNIKQTLDTIRPEAVEIVKRYALARSAYLQNPTQAGLDSLNTILGRLEQLSAAAKTVIQP